MPAASVRKSAASWLADLALVATGLGLAVGVWVSFLRSGHADGGWLASAAIGVPLVVLMSRSPLRLARTDTAGIEVGFESAVLVTFTLLRDPLSALTIWTLGQTIAQATKRKRIDVRAFNVAITMVCGSVAVFVMHAAGGIGSTSLKELASVGAGCSVFFALDYVISAFSVALEERSSLLSQLRHNNGVLAGVVFVAIDSLGYLGALVFRALPGWASVLLAVPVATILVASAALTRGDEHRRRMTELFDASEDIHGASSRQQVLAQVRAHARAVLAKPDVELRPEPPDDREVGARLEGAGEELWLVTPRGPLSNSAGELDRQALVALSGVGEQTLARLALVEQLAHQARRDSLTGLPNRVDFTERLERALALATPTEQVAVLYLDLDGFKSVNDRFGHAAGDDLLRSVADRLEPLIGDDGCVARLGGDEFAVMLVGVRDAAETDVVCRAVLSAVRRETVVAGHAVTVGTSIGVVLSAGGGEAAEVMRNADMAMYSAKAQGKSQHVVYEDALRDERIRRLELIEALRAGIDTELVVHYQPVVRLDSQRIAGMEALVRWERGGRTVPPDAFISAAEDSGLILPLGRRVLAQVVADAPALVAAAGGPLDLAVNMSAHQLHDGEFIAQVADATQALGDSRLVLEMTETVLVQDDPATAANLLRLPAAGARLSIDDFGTGFSSIGYLQHLPVDVVKVDRSFVRDIDTLARSRALVDAILVMASALELDVVAEGIEREEQAELLRLAGCAEGQGFLYARPQPLPDALRTLRSGVPSAVR